MLGAIEIVWAMPFVVVVRHESVLALSRSANRARDLQRRNGLSFCSSVHLDQPDRCQSEEGEKSNDVGDRGHKHR